ncbi:MAG: S10 family peptidase [Puniceicoccaceae bacterium]
MSEQKDEGKSADKAPKYKAPEGSKADFTIELDGQGLNYQAETQWIVLRKDDKPKAEMFSTAYTVPGEGHRPVTFVFNGGPGASSVYLHMGAMGPKRVDLDDKGMPLPPPHKVADNHETWLAFTDLVFVDPIGTGLSRMIEEDKPKDDKAAKGAGEEKKQPSEYWRIKRDLESIGEFARTWLSTHHRWESPVFIAGESYGGYRVGKLTKLLQKDFGVGLAGAIIISPALDFSLLDGSNYNVLPWVDIIPTMAAAALSHGVARKAKDGEDHLEYAHRARDFAYNQLMPVLAVGGMVGEQKRRQIFNTLADYIGLPRSTVQQKGGRIDIVYFVKNLLREQGKFLGLYDASIAVTDPFTEKDELDAPDPTLHILERVFASAINTQLRRNVGLETERDYELLSMQVNTAWKNDEQQHALQSQFGAVDDLRFGMSLNEHMGVYITHGYYDLVTAFSSSDRLAALMNLTQEQQENLTLKHYPGGHMFYTWAESRKQLCEDMKAFYAKYAS